MMIGNKRK